MKAWLLGLMALATVAMAMAAAAPSTPDPVAGNANSAVRVIIYQDLECPDCARWHGLLTSQFIPEYGARVGFEFRDFPLPQHLWSFNAAVLARLFDAKDVRTGLAWRDYCFVHQDEITSANLLDKAAAWAAPSGYTRTELVQAFSRTDLFALVTADRDRGKRDKVEHTPTITLNGVEATTPEQLHAMLDQALRSSGERR